MAELQGLHRGDIVGFSAPPEAAPYRSPAVPEWRVAEVAGMAGVDGPGLALAQAGFQTYRPVVTVARRCGVRGKRRQVRVALLGPYLFVNARRGDLGHAMRARLGEAPALRGFVEDGRGRVPEAEIAALRRRCGEADLAAVLPALPAWKSGDAARVRLGAWSDLPAVIEAVVGERARVMVSLFGGLTPAEVPLTALETAK